MARDLRNIGASVRARLLDRSRREGADFQNLLTRYALERLLYRLGVSAARDRFVLKGAMLFAAWLNDPFRPTGDLDLLGFGDDQDVHIAATFRDVCAMSVPADGVTFDTHGLTATTIREGVEYGGVRVRTTATVGGARVPIQIDVGFGDAITPSAVDINYPTLLDGPAPYLRAYPAETVVAEKFEALVSLGLANSRMKDFYDLWLISRTFSFTDAGLGEAIRRTFERRRTDLPADVPTGLSDAFVREKGGQFRLT
jgi:Nucleotidyl transferase AbiEii toxin, Type IV TA system